MAAYQGYAAVAHPHGACCRGPPSRRAGSCSNDAAERFGDEGIGYSGFAKIVLAQGEFCYAVFDERIFEIASQEEEFVELAKYGGLKPADDIRAIARICAPR